MSAKTTATLTLIAAILTALGGVAWPGPIATPLTLGITIVLALIAGVSQALTNPTDNKSTTIIGLIAVGLGVLQHFWPDIVPFVGTTAGEQVALYLKIGGAILVALGGKLYEPVPPAPAMRKGR